MSSLSVGQEAATETKAADEVAVSVDPAAEDRSKIAAAVDAYVAAFNSKDVDSLVSLWTADGAYVSRTSGEKLVGRDALRSDFNSIFSGDEAPTLAVSSESVEFISPNVALERGSAIVSQGGLDETTTYQAVYVKVDGNWLVDRISEEVVDVKATNYEHLKSLEPFIGEWIAEAGETTVEIDCQWAANQNFLARKYRVSTDGLVDSSGLQIIGWDAKNQQIRSWLFDSDGGFVKGEWLERDDKWVIQSVATLSDGASGSFTSIMRLVDPDSFTWQKTNRVVDGQLLPNTDEVVVRRK
ncbi:MAG: SgcJ/EcaC family oxidoreductase [Planctomycetales bacterium]|nr:SgcJ/EcaC family oxidoreductase [Planctomycetales bacterium]